MAMTPRFLPLALALPAGLLLAPRPTASAAPAAPTGQIAPAAPSSPMDPADHDARLAWFRQARYGLFIHWGLYAVPAGVWQGRPIPGIGEWIMHNAPIPLPQYEALARQFDPVKFDAEAWVQLA